jgi:hypothetical protein
MRRDVATILLEKSSAFLRSHNLVSLYISTLLTTRDGRQIQVSQAQNNFVMRRGLEAAPNLQRNAAGCTTVHRSADDASCFEFRLFITFMTDETKPFCLREASSYTIARASFIPSLSLSANPSISHE